VSLVPKCCDGTGRQWHAGAATYIPCECTTLLDEQAARVRDAILRAWAKTIFPEISDAPLSTPDASSEAHAPAPDEPAGVLT
jgi:hypothetical protein